MNSGDRDLIIAKEPFENVVTRESWTVHDEAGASCWEMFEQMGARGFVNVAHVHPVQDELIVVLRGRVRLLVHDVWRSLDSGDAVSVPAGVSHGLENPFDQPVLMRVRYTPAVPHQTRYFQALADCSQLGFMSRAGIPHPLYCALLFRLAPDLVSFWWFPPTLLWLYALLVAPLARALGYSLDELRAEARASTQGKRRLPSPPADSAAAAAPSSDDDDNNNNDAALAKRPRKAKGKAKGAISIRERRSRSRS